MAVLKLIMPIVSASPATSSTNHLYRAPVTEHDPHLQSISPTWPHDFGLSNICHRAPATSTEHHG
eukprot:5074693-Karenia_brevis.AAC.1